VLALFGVVFSSVRLKCLKKPPDLVSDRIQVFHIRDENFGDFVATRG